MLRAAAGGCAVSPLPQQLLQQTLVSSGTMTNRIDRLVERGLVSRPTDPNDGRGILVEISPAGLTRVDAAITRLVDAESALLRSLPAAEQKRLADLSTGASGSTERIAALAPFR